MIDEAQHQLREALETNDPDTMRVAADYHKGTLNYAEKIAPKQFGVMVKHAGADGGQLAIAVVNYGAEMMGRLREEGERVAREEIEHRPADSTQS